MNTSPQSTRGPLASLTGVRIQSVGACAPELVVRNEDLAEQGYDAEWIVRRTGIRQRRRARQDQATSDIAYEAARDCLERADVSPSAVDLILLATMTPDSPMPATACLVQDRLGSRAPALDMNAACAGFMYALTTGAQYVKTGCCKNVLVIGVDLMSRVVNPEDKKTFPLFGDGGGAVLLTAGEPEQGFLAYTLGADGGGGGVLHQPAGGTREPLSPEAWASGRQYIQMEGRSVFKWAVRMVADSCQEVIRHAGVAAEELDLAIFHQANVRIIDAALEDLHLPKEKAVINLDRYGNTSAGSIPLALHEAVQDQRVQPGSRLLLCGFGGGLAWGAAVWRW